MNPKNTRILIVEDTEADQDQFENLLKDSGYTVNFTWDGLNNEIWDHRKIVNEILHGGYACVIIDLVLNTVMDKPSVERLHKLSSIDEVLERFQAKDQDYLVSGVEILGEVADYTDSEIIVASSYLGTLSVLENTCRVLGAKHVLRKWQDDGKLRQFVATSIDRYHIKVKSEQKRETGKILEDFLGEFVSLFREKLNTLFKAPLDSNVGFCIGHNVYVMPLKSFLSEHLMAEMKRGELIFSYINIDISVEKSIIEGYSRGEFGDKPLILLSNAPLSENVDGEVPKNRQEIKLSQREVAKKIFSIVDSLKSHASSVTIFMFEENKPYKAFNSYAYDEEVIRAIKEGKLILVPLVPSDGNRHIVNKFNNGYPQAPEIKLNQHIKMTLNEDYKELITDLYTGLDYSLIKIDREIGIGRGGGKVLVVYPHRQFADNQHKPVTGEIVKIGALDEIKREFIDNIQIVSDFLGHVTPKPIHSLMEELPDKNLGAIRLFFVPGSGLLELLCDTQIDPDSGKKIIQQLFSRNSLENLYDANLKQGTVILGLFYSRRLTPEALINVSSEDIEVAPELNHKNGPFTRNLIGHEVELSGTVERIKRAKKEIEILRKDFHSESRITVALDKIPNTLSEGNEINVKGTLHQTQDNFLEEMLCDIFACNSNELMQWEFPFNLLHGENLLVPNQKCNPYQYLQAMKRNKIIDFGLSQIYGDLNLNNIIVSLDSSPPIVSLIDFANIKNGPIFYDFAELESDMRIRYLAKITKTEADFENLVKLEIKLLLDWYPDNASWFNDPEIGTIEPLQKFRTAYEMIREIRKQALDYRGKHHGKTGNRLKNEYLASIYFANMIALDLSDPAIMDSGKKLATFSAAISLLPLVDQYSLSVS